MMTTLVLIMLVFCGIVAAVVLGFGGFMLLVKLGVIVREAQLPPYQDAGDYRIDQGREVRPEEDRVRDRL
jgi:hypothetical protein